MVIPSPAQVQILLTERCNLRCKHCAVPFETSPADHELGASQWMDYIKLLYESGTRDLVLSGGEAFLRRDLILLAIYALELGMSSASITTNMSLITASVAQEIVLTQRTYPGFGIQVSIDGASPQTHDWMRGHGAFNVLLRNIHRFRDHGGTVEGVHSVLHRGNYSEFEALAKLASEVGAKNWRLFPILAVGRGANIQDYILNRDEWRAIFKVLPRLREMHRMDIMALGPALEPTVEAVEDEDGMVPNPNSYYPSRYLTGPDGEIFLCPLLRDDSLGNVIALREGNNWQKTREKGACLTQKYCASCKFLLVCVGVNIEQPLQPAQNWKAAIPREMAVVTPVKTTNQE